MNKFDERAQSMGAYKLRSVGSGPPTLVLHSPRDVVPAVRLLGVPEAPTRKQVWKGSVFSV